MIIRAFFNRFRISIFDSDHKPLVKHLWVGYKQFGKMIQSISWHKARQNYRNSINRGQAIVTINILKSICKTNGIHMTHIHSQRMANRTTPSLLYKYLYLTRSTNRELPSPKSSHEK
ncbi:hypothetical protein RF11_10569 [Thelohanellus kitauei]|uniref:Uncharacterized protein n=1 Tax=Thelohanellus kitauei TaxID=669202 RepID=A0A0C2J9J1_THEKT|nr:hypothetical protein RF11_10569 [Thelohanellus kitauei]